MTENFESLERSQKSIRRRTVELKAGGIRRRTVELMQKVFLFQPVLNLTKKNTKTDSNQITGTKQFKKKIRIRKTN